MNFGGNNLMSAYANGYLDPNMTDAQQQQMRARMFAQGLLSQNASAPTNSGWGAVNQAMAPILGAAMLRYGAPQTPQGAPVSAQTPNLMWNPQNPVGTSQLNPATRNWWGSTPT